MPQWSPTPWACSRSWTTPSAIRRALTAIGHPDAQLIERSDSIKRNGVFDRINSQFLTLRVD